MSVSRGKPATLHASFRSDSPEETEFLGRDMAQYLSPPAVVLLTGSLGAGKTTFTRGIARGLGLEDPSLVHSPSFTLVNIYSGECPIFHVDLYRLEGHRDLESIGLEDFMGKEGVTVVEWGEKLTVGAVPAVRVEIVDAGGESRIVTIDYPETGSRRNVKEKSDRPDPSRAGSKPRRRK
jgi:tRNA threonylcarbamoyladenosine biosynthesis protein TsaE